MLEKLSTEVAAYIRMLAESGVSDPIGIADALIYDHTSPLRALINPST